MNETVSYLEEIIWYVQQIQSEELRKKVLCFARVAFEEDAKRKPTAKENPIGKSDP